MSELQPDLLRVEVEREDEVYADRVDVHLSVRGSSLVSGAAALKRAKEVNQLVGALGTVGVREEDVFIQSVHAEVQSGLLTRSSSAEYQLRIRLGDLVHLPDVIETVGTRKNVTLHHTQWGYDGLDVTLSRWLQELLGKANAKAALVAEGLGVKLLGVHRFQEQVWDPDRPPPHRDAYEDMAPAMGAPRLRAPSAGGGGGLGFEVAHSKRVRLVVKVDYRVGGLLQ